VRRQHVPHLLDQDVRRDDADRAADLGEEPLDRAGSSSSTSTPATSRGWTPVLRTAAGGCRAGSMRASSRAASAAISVLVR
jgi:hypothetical protein